MRAAERLGYHHLTCSEHVAVPADVADGPRRPRTGTRSPPSGTSPAHDRADPARHLRARARLPPPARDRQALRHPRPRPRRAARPRRRRRLAARGVRPARRARSTIAARGPTTRCGRCGPRCRPSASPSYHGDHYDFDGVIVDPCARAGARPDLGRRAHPPVAAPRGRAGRRLGAVRPHRGRQSPRGSGRPASFRRGSSGASRLEVVLQPPAPLDPSAEPGRQRTRCGVLVERGRHRRRRPPRPPLCGALRRAARGHDRVGRAVKVEAGFFSLTEVTDATEHRQLQRVAPARPPARAAHPGGHRLGPALGEHPRLPARPRREQAAPFDVVQYLTSISSAAVGATLEGSAARQELSDRGRFHRHRRTALTGTFEVVHTQPPRVRVSGAAVRTGPTAGSTCDWTSSSTPTGAGPTTGGSPATSATSSPSRGWRGRGRSADGREPMATRDTASPWPGSTPHPSRRRE